MVGGVALEKILILDDDSLVLKALQRELSSDGHQIFLAQNISAAWDILNRHSVDLVLGEWRLDEGSTEGFFQHLKAACPRTERVMLSRIPPNRDLFQMLSNGLIAAFFPKPWEIPVFRDSLFSILETRRLLNSHHLLSRLSEIEHLPMIPERYREFCRVLESGGDAKALAEIVERDLAITARLLQMANSSVFSLHKISSVARAIVQLGVNLVKELVLALSLEQDLEDYLVDKTALSRLFDHSFQVNRCFRLIHERVFHAPPDRLHESFGITFNLGKVLLLRFFPDRWEEITYTMTSEQLNFYQAEQRVGFIPGHQELGAFLLRKWHFPHASVQMALNHHRPQAADPALRPFVEIVAFADDFLQNIDRAYSEKDLLEAFHARGNHE
jgi:HD-like signal output (HDOD) protein